MLELKVDFPDTLIDIDRKITISGAPAHTDIIVQTKTERAGHIWRSQLTVVSDAEGNVDLTTAVPISAGYAGASGMGLIHAQQAENAATQELFPQSVHHALHTEIEAICGDVKASTVLTQHLASDAIQRVEIMENGVKGVLFVPAINAPHPAVLVLKNQTDQPVDEAHAALYAARGYVALALDYDSTPAIDTDKEALAYFENAISWMRDTLQPKHHFVAVSGYAQGAELAIVLGVVLAGQVSAVLACEPTAEVLETYPLAVENLPAPLLLGSGKLHSASAYHRAIADRLQQHGFDYNFQWYNFEKVNAGLGFSHVPTTLHGIDAEQVSALAQANKALWFSMIAFLHQAVAEAAPGIPND